MFHFLFYTRHISRFHFTYYILTHSSVTSLGGDITCIYLHNIHITCIYLHNNRTKSIHITCIYLHNIHITCIYVHKIHITCIDLHNIHIPCIYLHNNTTKSIRTRKHAHTHTHVRALQTPAIALFAPTHPLTHPPMFCVYTSSSLSCPAKACREIALFCILSSEKRVTSFFMPGPSSSEGV